MKKYIWEHKNWHDFKYDSYALMEPLAKARRIQGNLLGKIAVLGITLENEAQAEILVEEVVHTSEMEKWGQEKKRNGRNGVTYLGLCQERQKKTAGDSSSPNKNN